MDLNGDAHVNVTTDRLEALKRLIRQDGLLYAEDLLEAARAHGHAWHGHFIWDNTRAGELYRLYQARMVVATVRLKMAGTKGKTINVRLFHHLRNDVKGHRTISSIASNALLRDQMRRQLADDLMALRVRYAAIEHVLAEPALFRAIDRFVDKLQRKSARLVGAPNSRNSRVPRRPSQARQS